MNNSDMPAMPTESIDTQMSREEFDNKTGGGRFLPSFGLSKREHYAGLAMQKCWYELTDGGQWQHFKYAAEKCVGMADALLAELEKGDSDE